MKTTCLVIDDEPYAVNLLQEYISQVPYLQLVHKCYNALEALEFLKTSKADLILLDINMPHLSGMQLARLLPPSQALIFTTAYSEFAVESYEQNALDYLVKPITFERFLKAVQKAVRVLPTLEGEVLHHPGAKRLFLKTGKAMVQVSYDDVLFIEGLKDYVLFHTREGKHIVYKRMKELEETLPDNFSRVHLSFIVNRDHIQRIEDNHVFISAQRISVSDKYRDTFLEKINKRLL